MMYGHVPEDTPIENLYELVRAMVVIAQAEAEGNLSHHKMAPGSRAKFQPSKEWYERRDGELSRIQEDAKEFLAEMEEHFAPRLGPGARIKASRRMVKT
jgi:hypothetical protein